MKIVWLSENAENCEFKRTSENCLRPYRHALDMPSAQGVAPLITQQGADNAVFLLESLVHNTALCVFRLELAPYQYTYRENCISDIFLLWELRFWKKKRNTELKSKYLVCHTSKILDERSEWRRDVGNLREFQSNEQSCIWCLWCRTGIPQGKFVVWSLFFIQGLGRILFRIWANCGQNFQHFVFVFESCIIYKQSGS